MSEFGYALRSLRTAVGDQIGGGTPPRQVPSYWKGDIPWASVKDFPEQAGIIEDTQEHISAAGLNACASTRVSAGVPLVCTRMAVGRAAMASVPIAINQDVKALIPAAGVSPAYLLKLLQFIQPTAESRAVGSTVKGIRINDYLDIQVPIADRDAQPVIACVLYTLDTAIHETESIIAKLKAVKQGLLHDLLTRGIDANGELRQPQALAPHLYKESPMGWIPVEWEASELNQLVDPARPIVYGILMPGYGHPGGVPVVKVKDIIDDEVRLDNLLLTSPQIDREYSRSRLQHGDLLFTIRGTVGRTALVPMQLRGANITQDTARLAIKATDARFVRACLSNNVAARFVATHTLGVAVQGINLRDVRRIPVPKPPKAEATEIADRLDAVSRRLLAETERGSKLKLTKAGLMVDLLTGRVQVTSLLVSGVAQDG